MDTMLQFVILMAYFSKWVYAINNSCHLRHNQNKFAIVRMFFTIYNHTHLKIKKFVNIIYSIQSETIFATQENTYHVNPYNYQRGFGAK